VEGGAIAALVVAGLAKAVGNQIASSADLGFLGETLKVASDVAGKTAEGPVEDWVNRWLRPKRRERMLHRATWQDLAGLAWGEHLYETDDGVAEQARRRLDAEWFVGLMMGPRGREVPAPQGRAASGGLGRPLSGAPVEELAGLVPVALRRGVGRVAAPVHAA
jgi:hypothetical protein